MGDLFLGREGALRSGWRAFLFYLSASAAYGVFLWAFPGLPRTVTPLGLFAVLFAASWLFLAVEGRPLASLGLRLGFRWALDFAKGLLGGVSIILGTALILLAAGLRLSRNLDGGWGPLALGALLYLVPALNEELAFRGYLFQRLENGMGTAPALLAMSVLFAAAHLDNPGMTGATGCVAFLNIFLAGLILGLAYLRTRSLALPMGIHLGWNWAQGALLGFGVSGTAAQGFWVPRLLSRPEWLTGGTFGLEGSIPCTFVCLIAACAMARGYSFGRIKQSEYKS